MSSTIDYCSDDGEADALYSSKIKLAEAKKEIDKLTAENAQLVALAKFGKWCFDTHREDLCDIDGDDLERMALKFGLLEERLMEKSCETESRHCRCAGDVDFPTPCYFRTPLAKLPEGIE